MTSPLCSVVVASSHQAPQSIVRSAQMRATFTPTTVLAAVVVLVLYFTTTAFVEVATDVAEQIDRYYQWFVHVQIMVFVGIGCLYAFLRRYSFSAMGLNFFLSALVFLEAILCIGACQQVFWNEKRSKIQVDLPLLIDCAFCAASGMIAFGAFIGKTTPTQITWLMILMVPLYALNQHLVIHVWEALDMGGTIVIHIFAAYYGLAASWVLSRRHGPLHGGLAHPKNRGSHHTEMLSMVGTLFLWIYWPSFNGALASVAQAEREGAGDAAVSAQFLSVVNTLLSLLGATLAVFGCSALLGGKLNMVHVQNSTLAGGVAMGSACTLRMTPGGSVAVGLGAGLISTLGYQYTTAYLERTIGLMDTAGIHNLHAMPGVLGGLVAGLAALGQDSAYLPRVSGGQQLLYQFIAVVVTMAVATAWGMVAGWVVGWVNPTGAPGLMAHELFDDGVWWEGCEVEPMRDADSSTHSMLCVLQPSTTELASQSTSAADATNPSTKSGVAMLTGLRSD